MAINDDPERKRSEYKKGSDNVSDVEIIEAQTLELAKELQAIKQQLQQVIKKSQTSAPLDQGINVSTLLDYIDEKINEATERITKEMKAETFKIWNALAGAQPLKTKELEMGATIEIGEKKEQKGSKDLESGEKKVELYKELLEERDNLIYELTDQMVAIESENRDLKKRLKELEAKHKNNDRFIELIKKFIKTDPRYRIIHTIRRTGVIAPVQLSFVLGMSLAQTNKYINEMEDIGIVEKLDDGTLALHRDFDQTMLDELIGNT